MDEFVESLITPLLDDASSRVIIAVAVAYYIMRKADTFVTNNSDEARDISDNDISKTFARLQSKLDAGDERLAQIMKLLNEITEDMNNGKHND